MVVGKAGTKQRLLDAAERLFAQDGFKTSLRAVTAKAGANLAAVSYHFGSKDKLIAAVFARRLGPLNRSRLLLLDEVEAAAGKRRPKLKAVLHAFIAPTIYLWRDHPHFMQLIGRLHSEPNEKLLRSFLSHFSEVIVRFRAAGVRAMPKLPASELMWRMHFLVGAMIHTWTKPRILERLSGGMCRVSDYDEIIDRLVNFGAGGLRA